MNSISEAITIKLADLNCDDFYSVVPDEYRSNNGGVYILRAFENDGFTPQKINRFLDVDHQGILYIGKADLFTHRTGDLARTIDASYSQKKHDAGKRYLGNELIQQKCPEKQLVISIIISSNPDETERFYLEKYAITFGEVPPLNRQGS